jgi:hypothetical protein
LISLVDICNLSRYGLGTSNGAANRLKAFPLLPKPDLHGHVFEVTEIDGKLLKNGAMRDTLLVLPHSIVKVQFDSDNPGNWMMHCHILYHQESGMMTLVTYDGVKPPDLIMHH